MIRSCGLRTKDVLALEKAEPNLGLEKGLGELEKEGSRLGHAAFKKNAPWDQSLPGEMAEDEEAFLEKVRASEAAAPGLLLAFVAFR